MGSVTKHTGGVLSDPFSRQTPMRAPGTQPSESSRRNMSSPLQCSCTRWAPARHKWITWSAQEVPTCAIRRPPTNPCLNPEERRGCPGHGGPAWCRLLWLHERWVERLGLTHGPRESSTSFCMGVTVPTEMPLPSPVFSYTPSLSLQAW